MLVRQISLESSFQYQMSQVLGSTYFVQGGQPMCAGASGSPQREAGGLAGPAAKAGDGGSVLLTNATVREGGAAEEADERVTAGGSLWGGAGETSAADD